MIQLGNLNEITASDIPQLMLMVDKELQSRKELWKRYHRKTYLHNVVFTGSRANTTVTFEKYITDIASGFLGGKAPAYEVNSTSDESKRKAIQRALKKTPITEEQKNEMQEIISYISNYNDDGAEHYNLIKDILMLRSAYEIIYENNDNEIVYSRLDPLQTVAIWDYSVPKNLIGLIRTWNETTLNDEKRIVEITDINGTRKYVSNSGEYVELVDEFLENNWNDVPAFAVEIDEAIFETVVDLITAYEQLIQNTRNMFQYNDESKLAISGYEPLNDMTTTDDDGNVIVNPARQLEDEAVLRSKTMYFSEGGDAKWIEKNINDSAIQNTLKTYIDLIMMNAGVPNTFDLGFTNADNASAIDRKFFSLSAMTVNTIQQLKMAYLRRWELIFGRVNLKNTTNYDFRNIDVILLPNQPSNESEMIDMMLKLKGTISDETIVNRIPLNLEYASEKAKLDNETDVNFEKQLERMKLGDEDETVSEDRQAVDENEQTKE